MNFIPLAFLLIFLGFPAYSKQADNQSKNFSPKILSKLNNQDLEEELDFERVIDGDTFIASGRKIRLWGIDAPERDDLGYTTASLLLESILNDVRLICILIDRDRYKREVMKCSANNVDVAGEMVKFGFSKDYKKYSGGYYEQEEIEAKKQKKGIWSLNKK